MVNPNKGPSWAAIILWLIFFWPVGLYYLLKKLMVDKEAAVKRNTRVPVLGWLMIAVGVWLIVSPGNRGDDLFPLFLICGGMFSLSAVRKSNRIGEKYRHYINAVVNHGLTSIQDIAAFVQVSEKTALSDLKKMIAMGYFGQAYIDETCGEIHMRRRYGDGDAWGGDWSAGQAYGGYGGYGGRAGAASSAHGGGAGGSASGGVGGDDGPGPGARYGAGQGGYAAGTVEQMATCKNCGAHNWIVAGNRNNCEFCGSPIGGA